MCKDMRHKNENQSTSNSVSSFKCILIILKSICPILLYPSNKSAIFNVITWRCSYHLYQDHNKFSNPYLTKNNRAKVSPSILFVISYRLKSTEWRNVISVESDAGIQGTRMRQELYIRLFVFFSKLYNPIL